jgi:tripartite-type tricarboxylate transporter receptor subunit TctC
LRRALLAGSNDAVHAQAYPARPIRFIVPYVPGGGVDFVGRTVAQKLSESWGHPVIVENRPGAGTNIGSELVARSAPDGYTLLVAGVPNTANMALYQKLPYDVVKDFAPVILLDTAPNILAVHPSVPAKSGQGAHRACAIAPRRAHVRFGRRRELQSPVGRAVPNNGGRRHRARAVQRRRRRRHGPDCGQVSMYFGTTPSTMPHVRTGKLRGLAVTTAKRTRAAPALPTIAEAGCPATSNRRGTACSRLPEHPRRSLPSCTPRYCACCSCLTSSSAFRCRAST